MKTIVGHYLLFGSIVVICSSAFAEIGLELSRDLSATSRANNLSLSYSLDAFADSETGVVGFANHWQYDFSGSVANVNLNSALADFEIKGVTQQMGYDISINEIFTLSLKYANTAFNTDEAKQNLISAGIYYQLGNFQVGYAGSNTDTYQVRDVAILGTNYTDSIKFNRKSTSYYLSVNWTKGFMTSINYTQYTYDKNLDNSYALLTTVAFLNRGSGSVANEIGSQLKNSFDLNMSFVLGKNWLLTAGLGSAQEYLNPGAKSNNVSFGADYEINGSEASYRIFGLLDIAKTPDVEGTSNSGQLGIGINF